jgi:hypothetical protein
MIFGFLLGILIVLSSGTTWADEPRDPNGWQQELIDDDIMVSDWFDSVAEGIDLFLVGKKITERRNETSVKLSNSTYYNQPQGLTNSPSMGVNLRLPNVEDYWNFKFTSYDESQERGVQKNQLRQTPRAQNYGASVGLFKKLGDVRTAFEPRIELTDPLKVSHSLSFESVADLKTYRVNPRLELFATPDKGTGFFEAINFNFRLTKVFSITQVNEGEYYDKLHKYSATNGVALGQVVTRKSYLTYGLYFGSDNRPSYHLENYTFATSWSQLIYNKILDYSVTPQVVFSKDQDFTGVPGISFTVNLNF